jgi:hypothetical protein
MNLRFYSLYQHFSVGEQMSGYETWYIPLTDSDITIRDAYSSLSTLKIGNVIIPWQVRLCENPKYSIMGRNLLIIPGSITLERHDYAHIVLGRGLLPKDEAFVIGFCMGTTKKLNRLNTWLFTLLTRHYPSHYRWGMEEIAVFKMASELGRTWGKSFFYDIDYSLCQDEKVMTLRKMMGLELDVLLEHNKSEKIMYPLAKESQRLITSFANSNVDILF